MSDHPRDREAHALLLDALAQSEEERAAFVELQCRGDAELRARLEGMIARATGAPGYFERLSARVGEALDTGSGEARSSRAETPPGRLPAQVVDDPELEIDTRCGHFRITGVLGKGGMGTVYRATDLRLGREVALKCLPAALAEDPDRSRRFEQEALILASLSHPNVAPIFGVQEHEGRTFLVLELIDGPSLEDRLRRGRLGMREALEIAAQIARALEAAHRAGIVHRDLKPANVKIDASGMVKVLDFGIATVLPDLGSGDRADQQRKLVSTGVGRVLGTVAYMSPEQARGQPVDERTDVWAWACVLYEMLTGRRAFGGETVTDALAAIIERDPDWSRLPHDTPRELLQLLQRCLRKEPRRRLRSAGDVWLLIEEILHPDPSSSIPSVATLPRPRWHPALAWSAVGVAALAGLAVGRVWTTAPAPTGARLDLLLPAGTLRTPVAGRTIALSPDGRDLAHTANGVLHVRPLDSFEDRVLEAGLGPESPVFSPDGEWIAFFARGRLMKISVQGGDPFPLCDATLPRGVRWGGNGSIVFSDGTSLWRVPEDGGTCEVLAEPDPAAGEVRFVWPDLLPGDRHVVFQMGQRRGGTLAILDTETGLVTSLQDQGTDPRYLPTGHLAYARGGTVFAAPFDAQAMRVEGSARPILDGVLTESTGAMHLATSDTGVLAYLANPDRERELVWVDRDGRESSVTPLLDDYSTPRASPDGSRVAVVIRRAGERHVWIYEVATGTFRQLTLEATSIWPDWAPGDRVSFIANRGGPSLVWWMRADGAGEPEQVTVRGENQYVPSWSSSPVALTWFQLGPASTRDIWAQRMLGEPEAFPVVEGPAHEQGPALSPDARWIAYVSNESGRNEIYVRTCPRCAGEEAAAGEGLGRRWQLSADGGGEPTWAPDGRSLYYRQGARMIEVPFLDADGTPRRGAPTVLFEGPYVADDSGNQNYDVAPDGRFLLVKSSGEAGPARVRVVLDWFEELPR